MPVDQTYSESPLEPIEMIIQRGTTIYRFILDSFSYTQPNQEMAYRGQIFSRPSLDMVEINATGRMINQHYVKNPNPINVDSRKEQKLKEENENLKKELDKYKKIVDNYEKGFKGNEERKIGRFENLEIIGED